MRRTQREKSPVTVPVVVMGLGFIGQEIARAALESEELEIIGAVDKSPSMTGRTLTDVLGRPAGTFKINRPSARRLGAEKG